MNILKEKQQKRIVTLLESFFLIALFILNTENVTLQTFNLLKILPRIPQITEIGLSYYRKIVLWISR